MSSPWQDARVGPTVRPENVTRRQITGPSRSPALGGLPDARAGPIAGASRHEPDHVSPRPAPRRRRRLELAAAVPPARRRTLGRQHAGPAVPASGPRPGAPPPALRRAGHEANLLGVSHLGFSVPDLAVAARFWVDVLGFEPINDDPTFRFLFHRGARIAVVLTDHEGTVQDASTSTIRVSTTSPWPWRTSTPGAVARPRWTSTVSPIPGWSPVTAGWHLNLRAPGNFPIELFVIAEAFAALPRASTRPSPRWPAVTEPRSRGPARSATAGRACAAPPRDGARRSWG